MKRSAQPSRLFVLRTIVTLCLFAISSNVLAQRHGQPNPSPTVEATPAFSATSPSLEQSLPEIATGTDELKKQLQEVERRVTNDSERQETKRTVENLGPELQSRAQQANELMLSSPALPEIQDLYAEWVSIKNRLSSLRRRLAEDAAALKEDIAWLNAQQSKWATILDQLKTDSSLEELRMRISQSLADIQRTKELAEERLKLNVTLQTRLSERDQFIERIVEKITDEKTLIQRGLFQADTSPFWDFALRRETDRGLERILHRSYQRDLVRSREFLEEKRNALLFAGLIFVFTFGTALRMRRLLPAWTEAKIVEPAFVPVLRRPFSLALFTGLLVTLPLFPIAPAAVRGLISVLFVFPTLRLIGPLTPRSTRPLLLTVILSTLIVQFIKLTTASPGFKRNLLALSTLAIGCVVLWLLRRVRLPHNKIRRHKGLLLFASRFGMVLIFASLIANLLGYFALSQVLTDACLIGAYYGVVLYTAKEIVCGVASTLMQTESAKQLAALRENHTVIIRWLRTLTTLAVWIILIISLLRLFTVRDAVFAALKSWLNTPIVSGTNSFTAGDIFTFLLVITVGFIGATATRVVLREDVLQRMPVRHGVPFAVSTITYYVLLVFIFILALLAAGVELSKFTLFTGAFGIGVGFGLQNAINNFASGLILLFERPIRERDILEVEGAFGEVTRIGMRSTSIRTSEEAEVIMPNSSLVAGKVVNWSRLGRRRPVELPVKVSYACNAAEVIELLQQTAATHAEVLADPPPKAFLQGFAENGLQFCLVFWVGRYYLYRTVLSDVAVSVTKALTEAKIEVPTAK